ncbi:FAD binding domain-containing protein [Hirsutella rhossiliensis]|uniref:FAD binding domain-containing protein n=1 Tax=Hirsutella rhossiliensis TaxID=111463 RepID=A0A9P8SM04_9HYPO|nr:FAD binding domain-containing protein [Hirsutella rhossiliensis]KAH0966829.1 FAD binding domain-containing protein [Hirsutella rhossiliensis]
MACRASFMRVASGSRALLLTTTTTTTHGGTSSIGPPPPACLRYPAPRTFMQSAGRRRAQLTADAYPELRRDERFGRVTGEHVAFFKQLLGSGSAVVEAEADVEPFNEDWMHKYRGQCRLVLRPASTDQGGNTGLVGGSVPVFDEIVVSMARMNRIHSFDDASGCLVLDAGCVLEAADTYLADRGHVFPLDLGAKGSCHVGGNVATNAGGLRFLRYGSLHGSVLGLEAVLPDGTVLDDLSTLRKNNTGYDLKQLFIGAEGSIGIITRLAVHCPQRPAAVNVAFLGLASYPHARRAFRQAKAHLSEILSAFELMDARSQQLVHAVRPAEKRPLDGDFPFYCLVETSGSNGEHDYAKLEAFLEHVMSEDIVADGVVAQDATQIKALWGWRESVPECIGHWGGVYKYDVSIPLPDMYAIVDDVKARLADMGLLGDTDQHPALGVVGYGHMGDCNLHLNVAVRRYDKRVEQALEPFVYEWIAKRKGSISAEHGLGLAKKKFIQYSRSDTMVALMKQIKHLYDPNGIMNPYKYI